LASRECGYHDVTQIVQLDAVGEPLLKQVLGLGPVTHRKGTRFEGVQNLNSPQELRERRLVHRSRLTGRPHLPVSEGAVLTSPDHSQTPAWTKQLSRALDVPVRHDERASVEDSAVRLHLTRQASKSVQVALELVTPEVVRYDSEVDPR